MKGSTRRSLKGALVGALAGALGGLVLGYAFFIFLRIPMEGTLVLCSGAGAVVGASLGASQRPSERKVNRQDPPTTDANGRAT